jgi:hypothetical protein
MKQIRLSQHAREQIKYHGVLEEEVQIAINTSSWSRILENRYECKMIVNFNGIWRGDYKGCDYYVTKQIRWRGKYYLNKQVRPIFAEELNEIVVITVYSYYF